MNSRSPQSAGTPEAVTITAKSLEQALVKAAGELGVTQDELAYEVVREETSKGLFSFFKNPVVEVKAWVKPVQRQQRGPRHDRPERRERQDRSERHERRQEARGDKRVPSATELLRDKPSRQKERTAREQDEPSELAVNAEPFSPEKADALRDELRDFCAGIVSRIAGEPVEVTANVEEGRLVLDIHNDYVAQQIAKNSKLAEALEHILRKKPRHLRQELPFRIFIDVSGARRKREEELIQMAYDLSAKVWENKRPIVLNYKSSYDRKIIHMALDKDERVYTKSIGSGPNRKLMILPSREGGGAEAEHLDASESEPV